MTDSLPYIDYETQEILRLAQRVHRLLGSGWSESIYCDALFLLCEERHIPCRRAAGVRGLGPVHNAVVCGEATLVRVCRCLEEETSLRRGLSVAGLEQAVLLHFADDGMASRIVPACGLASMATAGVLPSNVQ